MYPLPTSLFIIAIFLSSASALGINCRGSIRCSEASSPPALAHVLTADISGIDQGRWYNDGEQIACELDEDSNHFCAFLQNTGGAWGSDILRLAPYIPGHGCDTCGSVPYFYPSDNDVDHGE